MFDTPPNPLPPPALQQHPNFVAALRACGQTPLVLDGPAPLTLLRQTLWHCLPMAMLARVAIPSAALLADQLISAKQHRTPILISPDHPTPELARIGAVPLVSPATVAEIDLRPPIALRRAALHQKWRNRLTRAEAALQANTLRITRQNMPIDPAHWLLQADANQQHARGYRAWPPALTLAYARENPGQAKLFTAFQARAPIAAMLFLRHGGAASYHIGHTTPAGRALSAHTLLLWHAAGWLAAKGHDRLDLGLINTEDAAGLARFKLGAGAQARALGGTWLWWPPLGHSLRPLAALDHALMTCAA
ncbi:MAG: hypothetical protein ACI8R4_001837 [Paracoccaceae bacterium]|jgi:hypothetical protein